MFPNCHLNQHKQQKAPEEKLGGYMGAQKHIYKYNKQ